jgi:hypothetical protein
MKLLRGCKKNKRVQKGFKLNYSESGKNIAIAMRRKDREKVEWREKR